jgi:outer membrane protein OmpA-like peptidoglycan-associated protein
MGKYESAIASGSATDVETLRRQVEDQQIALRAIQERERLNEQSMSSELERLRTGLQTAQQQGTISAQLLTDQQADLLRRQQELEQLRKEREADMAARTQMEQQHQNAIAELTRKRQDAEAQAQQLQAQVHEAQAALKAAEQQASQAAQQAQQQQQQAAQQQQSTQAELEKTRQELAARDAEARRLRMQNELARIAATKSDTRGLIVTLPGIFFDTGKAVLKPGAKKTLTKIADQIKGDSTVRVSVEGHTDSVGSDDKNLALSEKRAQAVRDFLVSAGIPADHITASGKGEAEPVATNKTAAGRQQNRRVELVITNG